MNKFALALGMFINAFAASAADMSRGADNFYKSEKVTQQKVTFKNQYQMNVVGNLFMPKTINQNAKNPAIVVGHPMGAVKEQSANLYAQKLAEQGFVTLAISARRWITSVHNRLLIQKISACWASAAAEVLSSAPRKLTRV